MPHNSFWNKGDPLGLLPFVLRGFFDEVGLSKNPHDPFFFDYMVVFMASATSKWYMLIIHRLFPNFIMIRDFN